MPSGSRRLWVPFVIWIGLSGARAKPIRCSKERRTPRGGGGHGRRTVPAGSSLSNSSSSAGSVAALSPAHRVELDQPPLQAEGMALQAEFQVGRPEGHRQRQPAVAAVRQRVAAEAAQLLGRAAALRAEHQEVAQAAVQRLVREAAHPERRQGAALLAEVRRPEEAERLADAPQGLDRLPRTPAPRRSRSGMLLRGQALRNA